MGAGMRSAIDELHHSPIVPDNDIYHFDLSIGKGRAPSIVIAPVALGARQELGSSNILKVAIFGNYRCTTVRVP